MPKISFIGAGSYGFTFKLVVDILSYEALVDSDLVFMDVDRERLDNLKVILDEYFKMNAYKKQPLYSIDLEKSLEGADFVVNLVKIGFLEASIQDMDVPKKFGLYQTIGDTCGIGGIFRGLRTMVFNEKMLKTMEKVSSSKAVVINYTNPQTTLVMAAASVSRIPFIGLCHSVQGTTRQIARYLGVPYHELNYDAAGINHLSWITRLERNGEDLYPEFRRRVREQGIYSQAEKADDIQAELGPARLDMLNRAGYMVSESSHHFPEYVPYYLRTEELRKQYRVPVDRYRDNIARKEKQYKKYVEDAKNGKLPQLERSVEYGPGIIHAMVTGTPCSIYANVMNHGLIENLPAYSAVEVLCLADRNGVHPCHYGTLPTQLATLCNMDINVHQLAVEAFLKRDRKYVYWAMMADSATHSILTIDQMEQVADELIGLQEKYLGEYL